MMKTETVDTKASKLIGVCVLFFAVGSAAILNFSMTSTWYSMELMVSVSLILSNFILTLFLDHKAVTSNNFLLWGMLLKMAKSFMIFLVLAILSILKLVNDPKILAYTFLLGFLITMIYEVINLQRLTKKKQDKDA